MAIDKEAVKEHIRGLLVALGENPDREGLKDTPDRVARMYEEVFEGIGYSNHEIAQMFNKTFEDELEFEDGALEAIAEEAMRRETGARGLRAIIEGIMRDVMYEIPSRTDVVKCIVTEDTVRKHLEPKLIVA